MFWKRKARLTPELEERIRRSFDEASLAMAREAGSSAEEFNKMLAGTDIFMEPARCVDFMKSEQIRKTQESVKAFLNKHEKLDDMSAKVVFDPQYIKTSK